MLLESWGQWKLLYGDESKFKTYLMKVQKVLIENNTIYYNFVNNIKKDNEVLKAFNKKECYNFENIEIDNQMNNQNSEDDQFYMNIKAIYPHLENMRNIILKDYSPNDLKLILTHCYDQLNTNIHDCQSKFNFIYTYQPKKDKKLINAIKYSILDFWNEIESFVENNSEFNNIKEYVEMFHFEAIKKYLNQVENVHDSPEVITRRDLNQYKLNLNDNLSVIKEESISNSNVFSKVPSKKILNNDKNESKKSLKIDDFATYHDNNSMLTSNVSIFNIESKGINPTTKSSIPKLNNSENNTNTE